MTSESTSVLIVGGGLSGVLTAINLMRSSTGQNTSITLLNTTPSFGRGLAYSCSNDTLLLNVPAGNMSAFPDQPLHFVEFCRRTSPSIQADSFVSRRLYGQYLEYSLLQEMAEQPNRLHLLVGEAQELHTLPDGNGFTVKLATGQCLIARHVVLALGHQRPRPVLPMGELEGSRVIDPWDFERMSSLPPESPVLILGTGHTAVDTLFHLTQHVRPSMVWMISRRGLLPHAHRPNTTAPHASPCPAYIDKPPLSARALAQRLRDEVARQAEAGCDWRDVLNQLRPHTPRLWQALPLVERQRFLRHAVAFWDIHRHRLAPQAAKRLQSLLDTGGVQVRAAKLLAVHQADGTGLSVELRPRRQLTTQTLKVAAIINCTGPSMTIGPNSSPLLRQLARDGLLLADPCDLGLQVDDRRQVINAQGDAVQGLWYIGPMLKARHWEAIAAPELRVHAYQLAKELTTQLSTCSTLPTRSEPA